jgi:hypothetical protein
MTCQDPDCYYPDERMTRAEWRTVTRDWGTVQCYGCADNEAHNDMVNAVNQPDFDYALA